MFALHDKELACPFSRPCLGLLVHGRRLRVGSLGPPKPPKPSLSENVKVVVAAEKGRKQRQRS